MCVYIFNPRQRTDAQNNGFKSNKHSNERSTKKNDNKNNINSKRSTEKDDNENKINNKRDVIEDEKSQYTCLSVHYFLESIFADN